MAKPDSRQDEDPAVITGERAFRMIAFHPDRTGALHPESSPVSWTRIHERTVIEAQHHERRSEAPIVSYKHTRVEERWLSAHSQQSADLGTQSVSLTQAALFTSRSLSSRRRALALRYGIWAVALILGLITATTAVRMANRQASATGPAVPSVRITLQESVERASKAAPIPAPASKVVRISLAAPVSHAGTSGSASAEQHVASAASDMSYTKRPDGTSLAPSANSDAAVLKAIGTGMVEPWSDDGREGYVVVGPPEKHGAFTCREVTVVAKGGAQGDAVSDRKCVNAKGQFVTP